MALWPRNGPRGAWIPPDGRVDTISSRTLNDGEQQHLEVFFHPDPAPNRQPATVDAPCLPAAAGGGRVSSP